jgi:hypothetical protein
MIKYFELLLDLLDVENNDRTSYIVIANKIELIWEEVTSFSDLQCYHQYAFIFEWYKKLVSKEISEDEFTKLGDFNSQSLLDIQKKDSISFLKLNSNLDSKTMYVFDSLAQWIVEKSENIFYC